MMRMIGCFWPLSLLFLTECAQPGATLTLEDASARTLAQTTATAMVIQSPHPLEMVGNRRFFLDVANPGAAKILTLKGARQETVSLAAHAWTRIAGYVETPDLELSWSEGGELLLGEPYLLPTAQPVRPNVLLVSVDTLRHDMLVPEHMPETHALFANGVIFDRVYTSAPWTLPAHASLFTGLYPARHGVRLPQQKLGDQAVTLAEFFQKNGYYTLAVTEGNYVSAVYGLNRGFHFYQENPPAMMDRQTEKISKLADNLQQLQTHRAQLNGAPLFLFFHTYEVHCPYVPRQGLSDPEGVGLTRWLLDHDGKPLPPGAASRLRALYEAEVAYTDRLLAPVLRDFLEAGWLVVLVSDHGEEFGEHGGLLHADTLYEETARIPLALAGPGVPALGLATRLGSIVDVPVTLAGLIALDKPETWQGRNLLEPESAGGPVFAESFFLGPHIPAQDPRLVGVWHDDIKLIQFRNFQATRAELYDLIRDPAEIHNLQAERAGERDGLYLLIETYLAGQGSESPSIGVLTPEQMETLRALGYIQ